MFEPMSSRQRKTGDELRQAAARRQREHAERREQKGYFRFTAWVPKDLAPLLRLLLRQIGSDQRPQQRLIERAEAVAVAHDTVLPEPCRRSRLACRLFLLIQG